MKGTNIVALEEHHPYHLVNPFDKIIEIYLKLILN